MSAHVRASALSRSQSQTHTHTHSHHPLVHLRVPAVNEAHSATILRCGFPTHCEPTQSAAGSASTMNTEYTNAIELHTRKRQCIIIIAMRSNARTHAHAQTNNISPWRAALLAGFLRHAASALPSPSPVSSYTHISLFIRASGAARPASTPSAAQQNEADSKRSLGETRRMLANWQHMQSISRCSALLCQTPPHHIRV